LLAAPVAGHLVFTHDYRKSRAPARDATLVTPSDSSDLQVYGKLVVFNAHATAAEVIRVVPVAKTDDSQYVDLSLPIRFVAKALRLVPDGCGPSVQEGYIL
jgi:hypothetical protein